MEKHFWNLLAVDGVEYHLDLTWQQFPPGSEVREWRVRDRENLRDSPGTGARVDRLLARVMALLEQTWRACSCRSPRRRFSPAGSRLVRVPRDDRPALLSAARPSTGNVTTQILGMPARHPPDRSSLTVASIEDGIEERLEDGVVGQPCLFLSGESETSSGWYSPLGYRVWPRGDDLAEHHVMHLHEIHHKVLTDDTAFGSLVHVASRHEGWESLLTGLFDACRTVHESFASFMSLSLAASRHANVETVLSRYPAYMPLARRLARFLEEVPASHRRELAATGVARWSMSAPVLEVAAAAYPRVLTLADLPAGMRPDHRFRMILALSREHVGEAVRAADAEFELACGLDVDGMGVDVEDASLDAAWGVWEDAFVGTLVNSSPRLSTLPTSPRDGHLEAADALVDAAAAHGVHLELPRAAGDTDALSDVESVQRLLQAVTLPLRASPWPGALASAGTDVDVEAVLALSAAGTRPHLVVHARRACDLSRTFAFEPDDLERLPHQAVPVFAARNLVEDGARGDLILHTVFDDPTSLADASQVWAGRGVAAVCLTASCFVEASWQDEWYEELRSWPKVVWVDMGLSVMASQRGLLGGTDAVHGTYMGLGRADVSALVWHVEGHPHVMLALGDDLMLQLVAGQLSDLVGERLVMEEADWSEWTEVLSAVASTVLATEPFLRFDGAALPEQLA